MNFDDLFSAIIESNPEEVWHRLEHKGAQRAVFKNDLNLRIESHHTDDLLVDPFEEDWATQHPDPHAASYAFNIYYGATLVTFVVLVSVDGGRALLPLPEFHTKTPKLFDFAVAAIINKADLFKYMERAGLNFPQQ